MVITAVFGVLVVIGVCLAAVAGLELVQRLVPAEKRQQHNDVAGFLYAVVGVVYAVLLALLLIAVLEQYQRANETVENEANSVADIAWLAHQLPETERYQLQELARSYAQEVVDEEWPLDRKSTRLNSSHANISYAVFCLKKTTSSFSFLRHSFTHSP